MEAVQRVLMSMLSHVVQQVQEMRCVAMESGRGGCMVYFCQGCQGCDVYDLIAYYAGV